MRLESLTYSNPQQPWSKRWLIRWLERRSGRDRMAPLYWHWRNEVFDRREGAFGQLLAMMGIRLSLTGAWPPGELPPGPLLIIANHPFGIADGLAMLAIAEQLGRPYRILANRQLLQVPELARYGLPISFDRDRDALKTNRRSATEAIRLLREGTTIILFPAGGVAEAKSLFGKAEDMDWKPFAARLVETAQANVLPVHFQGQNSRLFLAAGVLSETLRTGLHLRQLCRLTGRPLHATVGPVIRWSSLKDITHHGSLLRVLQQAVFQLSTGEPARR